MRRRRIDAIDNATLFMGCTVQAARNFLIFFVVHFSADLWVRMEINRISVLLSIFARSCLFEMIFDRPLGMDSKRFINIQYKVSQVNGSTVRDQTRVRADIPHSALIANWLKTGFMNPKNHFQKCNYERKFLHAWKSVYCFRTILRVRHKNICI